MKLITLLGAAALATTPAHALAHHDHADQLIAQGSPSYARAIAIEVCRYKQAGIPGKEAGKLAIDRLWPVYGSAMMQDGSEVAARYIVGEQMILCGLGQ